MVPADRFTPTASGDLDLWLPPALEIAPSPGPLAEGGSDGNRTRHSPPPSSLPVRVPGSGDPIELDKPVPPSGNMTLCGHQFWLGPARV